MNLLTGVVYGVIDPRSAIDEGARIGRDDRGGGDPRRASGPVRLTARSVGAGRAVEAGGSFVIASLRARRARSGDPVPRPGGRAGVWSRGRLGFGDRRDAVGIGGGLLRASRRRGDQPGDRGGLAFRGILLAIALVAVLAPGLVSVIMALSVIRLGRVRAPRARPGATQVVSRRHCGCSCSGSNFSARGFETRSIFGWRTAGSRYGVSCRRSCVASSMGLSGCRWSACSIVRRASSIAPV